MGLFVTAARSVCPAWRLSCLETGTTQLSIWLLCIHFLQPHLITGLWQPSVHSDVAF